MTNRSLAQIVTTLAVTNPFDGLLKPVCDVSGAFSIALQQLKRDTLCGFRSNPRHALQGSD
jgi:hypothetical protein